MGKSILIKEDEPVTALLIEKILVNLGYHVAGIARDGMEAVSKSETLKPDLVLMDIGLPGKIDGVTAANQINTKLNIPIIYATATSDNETLQRVLKSDLSGYVLKPIDPTQLYTTVETALHRAELERNLKELNDKLEEIVEERTKALKEANRKLLTEIDRRKLVEKGLEESLENEKEISELKSRLVRIVSHEFKTPLTSILSSAELINHYTTKPDKVDLVSKHASTIKRSAIRLTDILNDTLFFDKTNKNDYQLSLSEFDVVETIQMLINDLPYEDAVRNLIKIETNQDQVILKLDRGLFYQVIQNLVTNAIKYNQDQNEIRVVINTENENRLKIKVIDKGIGIPSDEQKHLFEIFQRASNVENIEGSGIGLAIVKQSIELLHGNINMTSEKNKGTCFTVNLPKTIHA